MTCIGPELIRVHGSWGAARRRRVEVMAASLILAKINPTTDEANAIRDMLSRGWKATEIQEVLTDVKTEWTVRRRKIDEILAAKGKRQLPLF